MLSKTNLKELCITVLLGCLVTISTPAYAINQAVLDLFKILRDKGSLTNEEYDMLVNAANADDEKIEVTVKEVKAEVEEITKDLPTIKTQGKFEISKDGWKWRFGGRLMADAAFYDEDTSDAGTKTSLGSGSEFRRARLYASGTLWTHWDFKAQFDFAENAVSGKDLYLRYTGLNPLTITVGHTKEPFGLEEQTSSKYFTFMERPLPNTFSPGRNLGVRVNTHFADMVTVAGGFFGEGVSDSAGATSEGYGASGRVTFSPVHEKTRAIHLGAAVAYRAPNDDDEVRFSERPESHISSTRLVDTGTISGVDYYNIYGLEAAAVVGPFTLQGEYTALEINRESGFAPDLSFDGYYIQGSWFLTGESRNYNWKTGAFNGTRVLKPLGSGGYGAWQLGLRFSSIDLSDRKTSGGTAGGSEDNFSLGLNWYPNNNIRFMANYVSVLNLGEGAAFEGAEPSVFQLRTQVHW